MLTCRLARGSAYVTGRVAASFQGHDVDGGDRAPAKQNASPSTDLTGTRSIAIARQGYHRFHCLAT
jgi:hypothetical protein